MNHNDDMQLIGLLNTRLILFLGLEPVEESYITDRFIKNDFNKSTFVYCGKSNPMTPQEVFYVNNEVTLRDNLGVGFNWYVGSKVDIQKVLIEINQKT